VVLALFPEGSLYWPAVATNQPPLYLASPVVTFTLHFTYYHSRLESMQANCQQAENNLEAAHRFIQKIRHSPLKAEMIMMEMIQHEFLTSRYYYRLLLLIIH